MKTLSRFFKLALPFWASRQRWADWLLLGAVVGFALLIIQVSVLITEWNKAFYDALADFNGAVLPPLILRYLGYIALVVGFIVAGNWLRKLLIFRWRAHLTEQLQRQWLTHSRHYRLSQTNLDNPDQRIAEDAYLLAEKSIDLFKYFIMNVAKLGAFVVILWQMSGIQHFSLFGVSVEISGYLVWIALLYSALSTLIMHWIGHKLQPLNVERQHREADFRANLLHVREHSEQIALYHGESQELSRLSHQFHKIRQNWRAVMNRELKIETFSATYLRLSLFIPIFATLPMYLARTMTFGDMMQARSAFSNVQDGFGWFMDYYKRLIEWAAVVERLAEFQQALQTETGKSAVQIEPSFAPEITVQNLSLYTPDKRLLFANFSLRLTACNWLLLEGESGVGKSTLLKTLAGLWQHYQGEVRVRAASHLFLPQKPYLAPDSLRGVLSYPHATIADNARLQRVLEQVGLARLCSQLDCQREWQKQLSGGEQQRISLARALLHKPQLLFLDEATNQLDSHSAVTLLRLLQRELPDSLCLVVSHQPEVQALFEQRVKI